MLIVSAVCGLRASELRGLRWQDVNFGAGEIRVCQRADTYNEIGEPKSAAGLRKIPAGPMVINALRQWRLTCPIGEQNLVFPNRSGNVEAHGNIVKRHFKPLCKELKISMRWHDLRHFAVSLWIEQGFSVKAVMSFAGHNSVMMTMERYGHLFPSPDHQHLPPNGKKCYPCVRYKTSPMSRVAHSGPFFVLDTLRSVGSESHIFLLALVPNLRRYFRVSSSAKTASTT